MNFYSFLLLILQKSLGGGGGGQEWQEGRETQIILNVLVLQCNTTHMFHKMVSFFSMHTQKIRQI
jgi:hypothetical protein